jgi:hypothetical protein
MTRSIIAMFITIGILSVLLWLDASPVIGIGVAMIGGIMFVVMELRHTHHRAQR